MGLQLLGYTKQHLSPQPWKEVHTSLAPDSWDVTEVHALVVIQMGMHVCKPNSLLQRANDSSRSQVLMAGSIPRPKIQHTTFLDQELHLVHITSVHWPGPCALPLIHKFNDQLKMLLDAMGVKSFQQLSCPVPVCCCLEATFVLLLGAPMQQDPEQRKGVDSSLLSSTDCETDKVC